MFRTVVIPLDGSEHAERVVSGVVPLRSPEATLHLVRIAPVGSAATAPLDRVRHIEAGNYLSFLASELGGAVRTEVRRGPAADEILAAAGAAGADLIALSARGESGARRFGSTAGRVILSAACPVFVLESLAAETGLPRQKPARLMVALDGSPESETALAPARSIARASGGDIVLFRSAVPQHHRARDHRTAVPRLRGAEADRGLAPAAHRGAPRRGPRRLNPAFTIFTNTTGAREQAAMTPR